MSHSRDIILKKIRNKLAHEPTRSIENTKQHLKKHLRSKALSRVSETDLLSLFIAQATHAGAEIFHVTENSLTETLQHFFEKQNIARIRISDTEMLKNMDWKKMGIHAEKGAATIDDQWIVTECNAAIAETGTLMMLSQPETPTTLNFLAETQVVILRRDQIVASYEDALEKIRDLAESPRCIHFITGPSRTGDIEQTILLGAHGPKALMIFIY